MVWSKITNKKPKPIGWWYHKIMCEFWWCYKRINHLKGERMYYYHIRKMCDKYQINLYGEKIISKP